MLDLFNTLALRVGFLVLGIGGMCLMTVGLAVLVDWTFTRVAKHMDYSRERERRYNDAPLAKPLGVWRIEVLRHDGPGSGWTALPQAPYVATDAGSALQLFAKAHWGANRVPVMFPVGYRAVEVKEESI